MRILIMIIALMGWGFSAQAQDMSDAKIKELALQAILENPEIIMQAVAILEQRDRDRRAAGAVHIRKDIANDANAAVLGNPDGDVTIVEFFDYNCGFCRKAGPAVLEILKTDPNVRLIMREWPILSEDSIYAAQAALAVREQGKYEEFHWAVMNGGGRATPATILKIARDLGLDIEKLKTDMESEVVTAHLQKSTEYARALEFTGTPAFLIGDVAAPGYITATQMRDMIAVARAAQ